MQIRERPPYPPALVLAFGVAAVSTGAIFVRKAEAPALSIAFWRCAIAAAVVAAVSLNRGSFGELRTLSLRERGLAAAAGFFLALHFASWITSLEYTTVASSVLMVNTGPIWVALLTPILSSDRLARGTSAGILLAVVGGAVVAGGDLEFGGRALFGDGLALVGAVAAGLYLLAGRRLREKLSLATYTSVCYGAAAVFLLPAALASGATLVAHPAETWGWLLACALVPQLLGHTAANWALRWATAVLVAVSLLGEPVLSALLAAAFLGETPPLAFYIGAPLVLVGIFRAAATERNAAQAVGATPDGLRGENGPD